MSGRAEKPDWARIAEHLRDALELASEAIAVELIPVARSRCGQRAASCELWERGSDHAVDTALEEHLGCGVGAVVHGALSPAEARQRTDVAALAETGWLDDTGLDALPAISRPLAGLRYRPLGRAKHEPDAVLFRLRPKALVTLQDAGVRTVLVGKPQCQIVPLALDSDGMFVSPGCAVSRARTGMPADQLTCAVAGSVLVGLSESLQRAGASGRAAAMLVAPAEG